MRLFLPTSDATIPISLLHLNILEKSEDYILQPSPAGAFEKSHFIKSHIKDTHLEC